MLTEAVIDRRSHMPGGSQSAGPALRFSDFGNARKAETFSLYAEAASSEIRFSDVTMRKAKARPISGWFTVIAAVSVAALVGAILAIGGSFVPAWQQAGKDTGLVLMTISATAGTIAAHMAQSRRH